MKKLTCFILGWVLIPSLCRAADVYAYFVGTCDSSSVGTVGQALCDGDYEPCVYSSAIGGLSHLSSGSYTAYKYCVPYYEEEAELTYLVCFTTQANCQVFTSGCNSRYYGDAPILSVTVSAGAGFTISNIAQFECCKTTTGYTYVLNSQYDISRRYINNCATDGSASTTVAGWSCPEGYYSSAGLAYHSATAPMTASQALACKNCVDVTGDENATSDAGSTSPIWCYIPAGTTYSDDTGTYEYTSNCYYQ